MIVVIFSGDDRKKWPSPGHDTKRKKRAEGRLVMSSQARRRQSKWTETLQRPKITNDTTRKEEEEERLLHHQPSNLDAHRMKWHGSYGQTFSSSQMALRTNLYFEAFVMFLS